MDRPLTAELLDLAADVAARGGDRGSLTDALAGRVSATEAKGRTRAHLARTWVTPPEPARPLLAFALDNPALDPSRRLFHFGALLASTPLVGRVTARAAHLVERDGALSAAAVEGELARHDRLRPPAGHVANVLSTLRAIGLLAGPDARLVVTRVPVPRQLAGWFLHALLLGRGVEELNVEEYRDAPELCVVTRIAGGMAKYPGLELVQRGPRMAARPRG